MAPNWSQNFNASYPNLPQFHDFFRFFCNFSTAHITPGDCCHSGDGLEPAREVVDYRYSDCRSDFGYLYARVVKDDLLGFFDTEGIEPLMKVCSQYMVEVKREIVTVDADVFCEGFVEKFRKTAFIVSGFSIKDADALDLFDKIAGKGTAKIHDIYIDIETIEQSCKFAEANYGVHFPLDDAIKCIITHELMHSISVGYADTNPIKDEAHTDYLAKRIYEAFYPDKKYFTSYDYPMPPKLIIPYEEQVKLITPESIYYYLRGK